MLICIYFCVISLFFAASFGCKDENNNHVDWYVIYKLPKIKESDNDFIREGLGYVFITSNSKTYDWQLSNLSINDSKSLPGLSLSQFYAKNTSMHVLYNDEVPPNKQNNVLGHTKGVILSDLNSGSWIIHSVPLYPPLDSYSYPETARHFGQSFLCLSLNIFNLNEVGKQLLFNEPNIYSVKLDTTLTVKLPNLKQLIEKKFIKKAPFFNLITIRTLLGEEFLSFAKTRKFGKDLYDLVSVELKQNLFVESWLRGRGKLNSDCKNKFFVKNVEKIAFKFGNFSSENDHSKWTVSTNEKSPWFCVGDINRQEHQKMRGGGTVCSNKYFNVWKNYYSIINQVEPCNNQ